MIETITSFAGAWAKADRVEGWLTEVEAAALFDAAVQTPEHGLIVEVGCYRGRSLTVLAETGRRIIAVDPLELGMSIAKQPITVATVAALQRVVDEYPNIKWIRERSEKLGAPSNISLLHIDACHKYPFPLADYRTFEPGLARGSSIVAWHDYGREFGVTRSVDELIEGGRLEFETKAGTMVITRKT